MNTTTEKETLLTDDIYRDPEYKTLEIYGNMFTISKSSSFHTFHFRSAYTQTYTLHQIKI